MIGWGLISSSDIAVKKEKEQIMSKFFDNKTKQTIKKQKVITLVVGLLVIVAIIAGGCALNYWGNSVEQQMLGNANDINASSSD